MGETRKLAAILVADVVGYSRLTGADEEGTLARLRTLRGDLFNPTIASHNGRVVKRTGDGVIVEFRSVVEAVRCALEVRSGLAERNAGLPDDKRIEARVGIHLGDVVEEADGDLMGDGVNVAARLESICETNGICLSEDAWRQVRDKLDVTFFDLGDQNLKNIARPVRAYALTPTTGPRLADAGSKPSARRLRATALVAAVIAILENVARVIGAYAEKASTGGGPALPSAGGVPDAARRSRDRRLRRTIIAAAIITLVAARIWRGPEPFVSPPGSVSPRAAAVADLKLAHAPRLSIVVLPFANLSGDPEQDYFANALTDDLTSDLAHIPDSFVIGRSTAAAYKDKPVDLKKLGRDLGVRYAVEGSVRRAGETIAVNAQLVSTETGTDIWADRLEGERSRLGELQIEFVSRLANALNVQLVQAASLRAMRERPNNPDALDNAMRGWAAVNAGLTLENLNKAITYFDEALRLDPNLPQALTGKAHAQLLRLFDFRSGDWTEVLLDADQAADRVLAAQPNNAMAHFVKALVLGGRGQYDAALASANAAIAIDPNFAHAYAEKAHLMVFTGRAPEAIETLEFALRLDPLDPGRDMTEWVLCDAHAHLAQWEQAIDWCAKATANNPSFFWPYFELAAAYAWLGRQTEASNAAAELEKLRPGVTVQDYLRMQSSDNPTFGSGRDRIAEGLRKAGLP